MAHVRNGPPAVVLCSGGMDSAVTMAIARAEGYAVHALTFDYGQRHRVELRAARRVARALGAVKHLVKKIDLTAAGGFGGSVLTGPGRVPHRRHSRTGASAAIPPTYVPGRNLIFLSLAVAYAEILGAADIFIGVNAIDYSGYPDCRPEFIRAFERTARLATKAGVEGRMKTRIRTPVIRMTKAQIIRKGLALGVDFSLTHSCYDPDARGRACGQCDACRLRLKGFREAGINDPAQYVK
ncbi:MAG: 7-cyano-7-deazaguanine synthase QueC [Candidatus Sumerlaeia bacterium]|nr:7-cyano-7-deazaguanine synthase QueC [Candidatus Sumerlaeia bacterium]